MIPIIAQKSDEYERIWLDSQEDSQDCPESSCIFSLFLTNSRLALAWESVGSRRSARS